MFPSTVHISGQYDEKTQAAQFLRNGGLLSQEAWKAQVFKNLDLACRVAQKVKACFEASQNSRLLGFNDHIKSGPCFGLYTNDGIAVECGEDGVPRTIHTPLGELNFGSQSGLFSEWEAIGRKIHAELKLKKIDQKVSADTYSVYAVEEIEGIACPPVSYRARTNQLPPGVKQGLWEEFCKSRGLVWN